MQRLTFLQMGLLALAGVAVAAAAGMAKAQTPEQKTLQLAALHKRSASHGVIHLTDELYPFYALDKPRTYNLIVLFTATDAKYNCVQCREVELEFDVCAENYWRMYPDLSSSAPLFFVRLDFANAPKTFMEYGLQSVPVVAHIPPSTGGRSGKINDGSGETEGVSKLETKDKFPLHAGHVDAESIAAWVNTRASVSIEIYKSPLPIVLSSLAFLLLLALLAKPLLSVLPTLLILAQNKYIWMAVSAVLYICSISGLVFDIIRNPPSYHVERRSGRITFFHPQSGQQFVVEGFIIGAFNISCALAAILLAEVSLPSSRLKHPWWRKVVCWGCLVAFPFFFYQIFSFYRMKNRWYMRI